jgi:hypothetical protein
MGRNISRIISASIFSLSRATLTWGGVNVDSAFVFFLEKLFRNETIRTFRETHLYDYLELEREFEMVKRENSC